LIKTIFTAHDSSNQ